MPHVSEGEQFEEHEENQESQACKAVGGRAWALPFSVLSSAVRTRGRAGVTAAAPLETQLLIWHKEWIQ